MFDIQELIETALSKQFDRERNRLAQPREWHPETYLEYHESRQELGEEYREYGGR
jgi:hypothetical protein